MMKRKIRLGALLAVSVLMLALMIGGLYGFFQDTETSTQNRWTAGSLNLVPYTDGSATGCSFDATNHGSDGVDGWVTFGDTDPIVPGDSGYIDWEMENAGNLAGTFTMTVVAITGTDGTPTEFDGSGNDAGGNGDLDNCLRVALSRSEDGGTNWTELYSDQASPDGTLAGLLTYLAGPPAYTYAMPGDTGSSTDTYRLTWLLPGAGTDRTLAMGDTATLNMQFALSM